MDLTQSPKLTLFAIWTTLLVITINAQSTCNNHRFPNNLIFTSCSSLPALGSFLHWTYASNNTVSIAYRHPQVSSSSYIAWGLNPSGSRMVGTQALVAFTNSSGEFQGYTSPITSTQTRLAQGSLSFGVSRVSASLVNGEATIFATLDLPESLVAANQVWQTGPVVNGVPQAHAMSGENMRSINRIDFRSGQSSAGGGGGSGDRLRKRNTHGILNAISWGVLMPIGAMMARYMKVFTDPTWFYLHIAFQVSGYAIGVAGWATGIKLGNDSPGTSFKTHRNLGIALFTFATLQVFALLLRPKPDHKYRTYWNVYHHTVGYTTIVLSIVNIFKGFDILDPEEKWRWAYIGILIFLGAWVVILEPLTWFIVLRRKSRGGNAVAAPTSNKYSNGATTGPHQQEA